MTSRLPVGQLSQRWPSAARSGEGSITANVQSENAGTSQADDVPRGRKVLSVTSGDSSPKGEPRHRILAQEMERICIDTPPFTVLLPLNALLLNA